ncbi:hypothetical protein Strvi_7139 [Streptomyces violaceusniger Tu 4113]|uniref:Uncharacterized protein n=1 Tax=Streptomyces violaceusniger (strain Tu 4113) TaxID=653045 RepID=G2NW45_STRV4|nr:hypothetical protein Strvi_7139 [Streptomyces violaceusniger Tu 4113]
MVRAGRAESLTTWPRGYGQRRQGGPQPSLRWSRGPAHWHRTRRPRSHSHANPTPPWRHKARSRPSHDRAKPALRTLPDEHLPTPVTRRPLMAPWPPRGRPAGVSGGSFPSPPLPAASICGSAAWQGLRPCTAGSGAEPRLRKGPGGEQPAHGCPIPGALPRIPGSGAAPRHAAEPQFDAAPKGWGGKQPAHRRPTPEAPSPGLGSRAWGGAPPRGGAAYRCCGKGRGGEQPAHRQPLPEAPPPEPGARSGAPPRGGAANRCCGKGRKAEQPLEHGAWGSALPRGGAAHQGRGTARRRRHEPPDISPSVLPGSPRAAARAPGPGGRTTPSAPDGSPSPPPTTPAAPPLRPA